MERAHQVSCFIGNATETLWTNGYWVLIWSHISMNEWMNAHRVGFSGWNPKFIFLSGGSKVHMKHYFLFWLLLICCWLELGTWHKGQQNHYYYYYYYYYIMNHFACWGLDFRLDICGGHLGMLAGDPCFWVMLFSNWLLFTILRSWLFGNGSKNQQICIVSTWSINQLICGVISAF